MAGRLVPMVAIWPNVWPWARLETFVGLLSGLCACPWYWRCGMYFKIDVWGLRRSLKCVKVPFMRVAVTPSGNGSTNGHRARTG